MHSTYSSKSLNLFESIPPISQLKENYSKPISNTPIHQSHHAQLTSHCVYSYHTQNPSPEKTEKEEVEIATAEPTMHNDFFLGHPITMIH